MKKTIKKIGWIYLISWGIGFLFLEYQLLAQGQKLSESLTFYFTDIVLNQAYLAAQHILFILLSLLFILFQYFRKVFIKQGGTIMFKRLGFYLLLPVVLLILGFKTLVHINTNEKFAFQWNEKVMNPSGKVVSHYEKDGLHRGMSVFGWNDTNEKAIAELVKANVEWVAVIPFMYQENENSITLRPKQNEGNFTRRDSSYIKAINDLRKKGVYVHLKPHLWLGDGWRSNLNLNSNEAWDTWFKSYRNRMLQYAKMAQLTNAELFCIGTELRTSIKAQPEAWCALIADIRKIYDGKLTYAANWHDEYEYVPFWSELDYIGIQAYFPLTKIENPDLETIKKGWQPHIKALSVFSEKYNKPILFTEVGYKSEASATIKPWEWGNAFQVLFKKKSDRTQYLAYEALFEELWHRDWFAGVYIWEWDTRSTKVNAPKNLNFSPRFKPAENVIAKWFGKTVPQPSP